MIFSRQSFFLLALSVAPFLHSSSMGIDIFPFNVMSGSNKDISFTFLKSADAARQKALVDCQKKLTDLLAYKEELLGFRARKIKDTERKLIEALDQKIALLGDRGGFDDDIRALFLERKRVALGVIEAIDTEIKTIGEHETALKKCVHKLSSDAQESDVAIPDKATSWLQFKEARKKLFEEREKLKYLKEKKGIVLREGMRADDQYVLRSKQFEQELGELEDRCDRATSSEEREALVTLVSLQRALIDESAQAHAIEEELQAQREGLQETEYALQQYVVSTQERYLPELQERMIFEQTDVALAEQELKNYKAEAASELSILARDFRRLRAEREALNKRKVTLEALRMKNDTYAAELERVEQEIQLIGQHELYLAYRNSFITTRTEQKELQQFVIMLMYERAHDLAGDVVPQRISGWFEKINRIKKQVDANLERLNDYAQESALLADDHRKYFETVSAKMQGSLSEKTLYIYDELLEVIGRMRQLDQDIASLNTQHIELCISMKGDIDFVIDELLKEQRSLNIWQRSRRAVSYVQLKNAWAEMVAFATVMYQKTLAVFSPFELVREAAAQPWSTYALLLYLLLFLALFIMLFQWGTRQVGRSLDRLLYIYQGKVWAIYLTIARSFVRFIEQYSRSIACWLCIRLHIACQCGYYLFAGLSPVYTPYFVSLFYLSSILLFVYLAYFLMREIKTINQRMSFLFFTEALQEKFLLFLSLILYISAVLLPLRKVFVYSGVVYGLGGTTSAVPDVIYGAWTLAISLVFLLFFSKQDVLRIIPSHGKLGGLISQIIDQYYYPAFFFIMGLLILINPYVGYSNLAMYLSACVPLTVLVVYVLLALHARIRQYSISLFIKEEEGGEEEVADRFEHAKMYYGAFILITFLVACMCCFLAITHIWGIDYTLMQLWHGLSRDWVLSIEGTGVTIGFGGLLTLFLFVVIGFVVSSLFNRFVMAKLFGIFRVEPGAQNTATRIAHYLVIFLSIVLGLYAIRLGQLASWVLFGLALGISFGAKNLVGDFFSGLWLLIERPIEPGHYIEHGTLRGVVKKIALRATTIRTAQNYSVIVPNSELTAKPIINWGGGYYAVGFEFDVTISYHADPQKVRDLIIQVASSNPLVLRVPAVMVRLEDFRESGMLFKVRAFISSRRVREQWDIAGAIRIELMKTLQENNIGIPYPHLVIKEENAFGQVINVVGNKPPRDEEGK